MDAVALLLRTAFRNVINEPNIEAGFARFKSLAQQDIPFDEFCDAVASCGRNGLVHEPVRLPEGALQCHWHLELTAKGVEAARSVSGLTRPDGSKHL